MIGDDLQAARSPGFTVTISRQMGSLGGEVARLAARLLGYRFTWREVINQAAIRAGAPEAALAAIDELGLLSLCPSPENSLAYRKAVESIMGDLASVGNIVILGRAGQIILAGQPRVLHVRILAPVQVRVERVAARQNIALKHARAQVTASDRSRRKYLKQFYNARWEDPELYDLAINTSQMDAPAAAALIQQAVTLGSRSFVEREQPSQGLPVQEEAWNAKME